MLFSHTTHMELLSPFLFILRSGFSQNQALLILIKYFRKNSNMYKVKFILLDLS